MVTKSMARKREIHFGFFKNEDIAELPPLARLLLIGMWNLADREGRLEDRPKKLKMEVLPGDNCDGEELIAAIAAKGFIVRYAVNGEKYIQIDNWHKYQHVHPKETPSVIPSIDSVDLGFTQGESKNYLGLVRGEPQIDSGNTQDESKDNPGTIQDEPFRAIPSFPSMPSLDINNARASADPVDNSKAVIVMEIVKREFALINSSLEAEKVNDWIEYIPVAWIEPASKLSEEYEAKSISYADKILCGWLSKGYTENDKPWEKDGKHKKPEKVKPTSLDYIRQRIAQGGG